MISEEWDVVGGTGNDFYIKKIQQGKHFNGLSAKGFFPHTWSDLSLCVLRPEWLQKRLESQCRRW